MIKVALKFCGGCDPKYDRVKYWERIKSAAGEIIEWARLDDDNFEAVLFICGCERACPESKIKLDPGLKTLSVKNGNIEPGKVVKLLVE